MQGLCGEWQNFISTKLSLPFDFLYVSSLTALGFSYDFSTKVEQELTTVCTDVLVIQNLLDSMQSGVYYEVTLYVL